MDYALQSCMVTTDQKRSYNGSWDAHANGQKRGNIVKLKV
jgi:hypothetical protein